MEGRTNFSRGPKQFDGLTWLTPTPVFYNTSTPHTDMTFSDSGRSRTCWLRPARALVVRGRS